MANDTYTLGHISDGIANALASPARKRVEDRAMQLRASECAHCKWFEICRGGCAFQGGLAGKDTFCRSYYQAREHIANLFKSKGAIEVEGWERFDSSSKVDAADLPISTSSL